MGAGAQPGALCYDGRMGKNERLPSREEMGRLADTLGACFIQRRDLYARQREDGAYLSIRRPLRLAHLERHLRGEMTLGAYVLDENSHGRYLVLDADDAPDWRRLRALAIVLDELGTTAYLEHSRRGGHLWLFLPEPRPGSEIRRFGQGLLDYFSIEGIELFPKQDRLRRGPGSLIRLPFGVHRKSGRRYGFYDHNDMPLAPTLREQIVALSAPRTVSDAVWERFISYVPEPPEKAEYDPFEPPRWPVRGANEDAPLSERIKAAQPVSRFVLQYVELDHRGQGLCPFHDDKVPSFHVDEAENFWYCFACDIGGSVIDFWMHRQQLDFVPAVTELARLYEEQGLLPPKSTRRSD